MDDTQRHRSRIRIARYAPPVLALLLATACYDPLGPREELVIGTVAFYSEPVEIDVPHTVQAGVPFPVQVRTYGGGCERIGPTEVTSRDGGALVVPRDFTTTGPGIACADVLKWFDHEAQVVLQTPGSSTVTIRGRVEPDDRIEDFVRTVVVE